MGILRCLTVSRYHRITNATNALRCIEHSEWVQRHCVAHMVMQDLGELLVCSVHIANFSLGFGHVR